MVNPHQREVERIESETDHFSKSFKTLIFKGCCNATYLFQFHFQLKTDLLK